MTIHKDFPASPFEILDPKIRWFPADEALRESSYEKLLPPLVHKLREQVNTWRTNGYPGASETSKSLLKWWFDIAKNAWVEGKSKSINSNHWSLIVRNMFKERWSDKKEYDHSTLGQPLNTDNQIQIEIIKPKEDEGKTE